MFYRFLNVPILTTLRSTSIHMKHDHNAAQKRSFPMKIFSINVIKPQFNVDLVAFTEDILMKLWKRITFTQKVLKYQMEVVFLQETGYYYSWRHKRQV